MRDGLRVLSAGCVAAAASAALAQHEKGPTPEPAVMPASQTGPAGHLFESAGPAVQVNTNAQGLDILGDAGNEPSIAVDPTAPNRIAVGWRQFDSITSSFREAGYALSLDGGRTWSPRTLDNGVFRTDPVLRYDADGLLLYSSLFVAGQTYRIDTLRSTDGGTTFGPPINSFGGDKQWIAVDRSNGIGRGHVYMAWNTAGNNFFPNQFNRSLDGGLTWSAPQTLPSRPVFGQIQVGPDGVVYVAGVPNSSNTPTFYVTRSVNAQDPTQTPTFTPAVIVPMGGNLRLSTGPNPAGLLGPVNFAIDPARPGWVYMLCSVDPADADPMDVHIARSTDGGATWSPPVRVNDVRTGWQWFGTMSVAPNGRIDAVWNDTRNAPATGAVFTSEIYYSFSMDGGDTWSPSERVLGPFNPHVGWPMQNKIGDYWDMESDALGADLICAATITGGQDVYYARLGPRDCNRNAIDDASETAGALVRDCDRDGIPDSCEIAAGAETDADGDERIDVCEIVCPGDVSGDGSVDLIDFFAFFGAYEPREPLADLNNDGEVDLADFFAFFDSFDTGCP